MADTLRLGDEGRQVKTLQILLNQVMSPELKRLSVDGDFGDKTDARVEQFQVRNHMLVDGVVGSETWDALVEQTARFDLDSVKAITMDKHGEGYTYTKLASKTAAKFEAIRRELNDMGGILTSSGGTRSLSAPVSANRSATSFHYSGRAHDLYVYSGMVDPHKDPYVVVEEEDRYWRVYARVTCEDVPETTLVGYTYDHKGIETTGRFVDLTRMFEARGVKRIRARRSFFSGRGGNGAAEWWHFQDEEGLIEGQTFFGHIVAAFHKRNTVIGSKPWLSRNRIFGVDWF